MENISERFYEVFKRSIRDYHIRDSVDAGMIDHCSEDPIDSIFYRKAWIDTVQWHLEDIVRDPDITGEYGLSIKRRIDDLNQKRTDIVELIDDHFQNLYKDVIYEKNARHNTESLGWAFDRLCILSLKEFHLDIELTRKDSSMSHSHNALHRKKILVNQKDDLLVSINWLNEDIRTGKRIHKTYKQLKMYNDDSFNPVLYRKEKNA